MTNCIGFLFLLIPIEDEVVSCRVAHAQVYPGSDSAGRRRWWCCVSARVGCSGERIGSRGGSPQVSGREFGAWHAKQERAATSTERDCYSPQSHPTSVSFVVAFRSPLYRRHVLAHDPPRIAPAGPLSKQHFPRLAFDPLPRRQSPIKEIIRHRDWYACIEETRRRAQADSFAQRRRTWLSSVVVLPAMLPPSRPVRRVSR